MSLLAPASVLEAKSGACVSTVVLLAVVWSDRHTVN